MGEDFISGFKKISDFYIRDSEGNYINISSGSIDEIDLTAEYKGRIDTKREENLIELQENLEAMSQAISDVQYLVDGELHDEEKDRNIDLKVILKLNRIENELEACYDMIIKESL